MEEALGLLDLTNIRLLRFLLLSSYPSTSSHRA